MVLAAALLALAGSTAASPLDIAPRGPERSLGWKHQTTYQGENWYSTWNFETFDDPTRGKTNYVNLDEAKQKNLTWVDDQGRFGMKADHWSTVSRDGAVRGRDSVRIQSNERFFDSLLVLDLVHMPQGCGTWPAFWTIGTGEWPTGGEIDIIEGTNDQGNNQYTVHTTTNCKIPKKNNDDLSGNNEPYSGEARALDCSPVAGCSIDGGAADTFGPGMNAAGGGFLVTRIKQDAGVSMWWYPRNKGGIPQVLVDGKDAIDEKELGQRIAHFTASDQCDLDKSLTEQQLIFNLAMCGGWCASRYPGAAQCQQKYPGKAWEDIIYDHPEEFNDAYWLINSLKVYQPCDECGGGGEAPPPASSASASASPSQASTSAEASSSAAPSPPPPPSSSAESSAAPSPTPAPSTEASSAAASPSPSPSPSAESESASSEAAQPPPSSSEAAETETESEVEAETQQAVPTGGGQHGKQHGWTSAWTSSTAWTSTTGWTSAWTSTWTIPAGAAGAVPTQFSGQFHGGLFFRPADQAGDDVGSGGGAGGAGGGSGGSGGGGVRGSGRKCGAKGANKGAAGAQALHAMPGDDADADAAWDDAYERWADEYQWHYHSQGNRHWKHKAAAAHGGKPRLDGGAGGAGGAAAADAEAAAADGTGADTEQQPVKRSHRHKARSWHSGSGARRL